MDFARLEISRAIDAIRSSLAQWTVNEQFERHPEMAERYRAGARSAWVDDSLVRIDQLADAVALDRPEVFADHVAWMKVNFTARKLPIEDIRSNLQALRDVVAEELPERASEAAVRCIDAGLRRLATASDQAPSAIAQDAPHAELARGYLSSLLEGRRDQAERLVLDAMDRGVSAEDVLQRIIEPAQSEVGRLWQVGEITVADEHMCTAASQLIISQVFARATRSERNDRRVFITSVVGDLHDMGPRMLAQFFEIAGWDARLLGANTPTPDLIEALTRWSADALALSCSFPGRLRRCAELIAALRAEPRLERMVILVGGAAFRPAGDLWEAVGADASAASGAEAVFVADRLVRERAG
ncbi:MAG: cobalamin-dependent protein [Planctomycetota bacterium]|nr:cobalamin-dependent protein [Planctomycetota bacterium]